MRIGIDLGGTNIAAAFVDESGAIIERTGIKTNAAEGEKAVVHSLLSVCEALVGSTRSAPDSVGIGVPGTVNAEKGEVVFTPNLPISGVNITDEIREKYRCPVNLGNDANCAALGEAVAGSAKEAQCAVMITLGTGVGGGVILGGKLHSGLSGAAGELGHMVILSGGRECGCGRKGCWETYASATGLKRTAAEFVRTHRNSLLYELCGDDAEKISGRSVFQAYRANDEAAKLVVSEYIGYLAAGIANIINIFEPDVVCIGGGISNEWDSIEAQLISAVDAEKYTRFSTSAPMTRIVRAKLGNDAGIIGAAMLQPGARSDRR